MRRGLAIFALAFAGCSTTPVADFLDTVAPGGPGPRSENVRRPDRNADDPRTRHGRDRDPPIDGPPPLPPVPNGYSPADEHERAPAARLQPRPDRVN